MAIMAYAALLYQLLEPLVLKLGLWRLTTVCCMQHLLVYYFLLVVTHYLQLHFPLQAPNFVVPHVVEYLVVGVVINVLVVLVKLIDQRLGDRTPPLSRKGTVIWFLLLVNIWKEGYF